TPIARRGNPQDLADRLDPEGVAMLIYKGLQDFRRRSSSAWAKNALASFRISLARRNSLTSRSSALRRSRSGVVTPSRSPLSTSSRLTHPSSVWLVQPILGAMDSIAAHCEGYSPRCSCTMRTARSRTSAENLFDLFIAPFSQELEPPPNPGRFRIATGWQGGRLFVAFTAIAIAIFAIRPDPRHTGIHFLASGAV